MRHDAIQLGAFLLGGVMSACPLGAQTYVPREFGTEEESIVVIDSSSFVLDGANIQDLRDPGRSAGGGGLNAAFNVLPHGSRITRITWYFHDTDPAQSFTFLFCYSRLKTNTGEPLTGNCEVGGNSVGVDGDSYVIDSTGYDVLYRQDEEGDGVDELQHYYLRANAGTPPGGDPSIRAVEILWRRQISPPPPDATFNDVPTNHPFFQFIEALADSGITAGCGGGNYCPDQPLTRGQMAVFLAKALGLHWPWDAP
jgi:hypothetical protein